MCRLHCDIVMDQSTSVTSVCMLYHVICTILYACSDVGRPGAPNRADPARAGPIILAHDYTKALSLLCHELNCGHNRSTSQYESHVS